MVHDTTIFEILITYTALVLTIIGGILAYLFYHFLPMKLQVSSMHTELYGREGHEGGGVLAEWRRSRYEQLKERETIREMVTDTRQRQIELSKEVGGIRQYVRTLTGVLRKEVGGDMSDLEDLSERDLTDEQEFRPPEEGIRDSDDKE